MEEAVVRGFLTVSCGAALLLGSGMGSGAYGAAVNSTQPMGQETGGTAALQMVMARAELKDSINAKKVKQGQAIRAKLEENVKLSDGRELGRDTMLEGHVDQVQPSVKRSDSTVVVTFDKARLKDGTELPIKATLLSIWEAVSNPMAGQMAAPPASLPGTQMTTGGPPPPPSHNAAGMGGDGHTPVPGVELHSDLHEKTSGTFLSKRENVDVPGGSQMQFELVVIPKGVQYQ